jgi:hypothetical protein
MKIEFDPLVLDTFMWLFGAKAFLEAVERAMPEAQQGELEALRGLAEREGWDEADYLSRLPEIHAKFDSWIPSLTAYSVIVVLHSLVETQLVACADRLQRDRGLTLGVTDIAGRGVERAKTYLTKVAGLGVAQDLGWEELCNLQKLRNIFVHRRAEPGESAKDQQELARLMREYDGDISIDTKLNVAGEVRVSSRLCRHFLEQVEGFFSRLFKAAGLPEKGIAVID